MHELYWPLLLGGRVTARTRCSRVSARTRCSRFCRVCARALLGQGQVHLRKLLLQLVEGGRRNHGLHPTVKFPKQQATPKCTYL